jgi:hypothetical protein
MIAAFANKLWYEIAMKSLATATLAIFTSISVSFAQEIKVNANLDTSSIEIGEQVDLFIELTHAGNYSVEWTNLSDSISGLEIVDRSLIDTLKVDDKLTKSQKIVLTSFDSGYYVIPPLQFSYSRTDDTTEHVIETEPLLLEVNMISVDTTKSIRDIKDLKRIPFGWQDALPYIYGVLGLMLLGLLIYFIFQKVKKPEKAEKIIPQRPAHEIALEALQNLSDEKLWQNGYNKEYHSRLSDIIREFISNKWSLHAMELTTDEILMLNPIKNQSPQQFEHLKKMLQLADLVKFAKADPLGIENENSFDIAIDFVNANLPLTIEKNGGEE